VLSSSFFIFHIRNIIERDLIAFSDLVSPVLIIHPVDINPFCSDAFMKFVLKSKPLVAIALLTSFSGLVQADQAALSRMRSSDFLLGTAPTGCQPKGLRSDEKGELAYVAEMCGKKINNQRVATVSIYNLKTLSLEKTIVTPSGSRAGVLGNAEVEFTQDQDFLMASRVEGDAASTVFPGKSMITVIDAKTQEIKEFIPTNSTGAKIIERRPMVAGDRKEIVYVANYFSDDISVLDVTNMQSDVSKNGSARFVTKIQLHSAFAKAGFMKIAPRGTAFTADGRYGLVDASTTGSIMIVDAVNHRQIAELAPIPQDIGSVPLRQQNNGMSMNVRHIALTNDHKMAYLSHMRGDAISRISVDRLIQEAIRAHNAGEALIPSSFWHELLVPFANGKQVIKVSRYPKDAPPLYTKDGVAIPIADRDWDLARPNTIVLDPINNRYLYVSCRTDTDSNYVNFNTNTRGKVDVIDTTTGEEIFTFVGGSQPTALEVTPDNSMLISGGFKDSKLYFFDLRKLLNTYEQ
jgi:DNA-binding beta-propeller fold protein YncE